MVVWKKAYELFFPCLFKKENKNTEGVRTNLIATVNQLIGGLSIGGEDFQVGAVT